MASIAIRNNLAEERFEAQAGDQLAVLTYRRRGNRITFLHTGVPPEAGRQGIGSMLVKTALDYARQEKLQVVARCPFVASYIARHPEYADLMSGSGGTHADLGVRPASDD